MAEPGIFETDDDDIVNLMPADGETDRRGWVNIGPFAIEVELNESGKLSVIAKARGNEGKHLAEFHVEKAVAVAEGGTDYDAQDQ